jgi:hypothetical protein
MTEDKINAMRFCVVTPRQSRPEKARTSCLAVSLYLTKSTYDSRPSPSGPDKYYPVRVSQSSISCITKGNYKTAVQKTYRTQNTHNASVSMTEIISVPDLGQSLGLTEHDLSICERSTHVIK